MSFWDFFRFNRTQLMFKRGLRAANEGRYEEATELLTEVIAKRPDHFLFYYLRGYSWYRLGRFDEALRDFDAALTLKDDHPATRHNRGILYWHRREYDRAIGDFSVAIDLGHDSYETRALAYGECGRAQEAFADIEKALQRHPKSARVWTNRSHMARLCGDIPVALRSLEEALHLDPAYRGAHNNLAWILATSESPELRDGKRALEHALKAVGDEASPALAYIGTLAAAYAEAGNFPEAVRWAEKFLQGSPPEENLDRARQRLELYRSGQAYREPPGVYETVRREGPPPV
jgi:tetratricopeptide (TPR) repeat protein